jgi:uncharacterized hydrophobic protein (TIGR00271 family)
MKFMNPRHCAWGIHTVQETNQHGDGSVAIALVVKTIDQVDNCVEVAWRLAVHRHEGLTVVAVVSGSMTETLDIDSDAVSLEAEGELVNALYKATSSSVLLGRKDPDTPQLILRKVQAAKPIAHVQQELERLEPTLVIIPNDGRNDNEERTVGQQLLKHCRFPIMAISGIFPLVFNRVLVPYTPGDHTVRALSLAHDLATAFHGQLTLLHFVPASVEHGDEVGRRTLLRVLKKANIELDTRVDVRIVETESTAEAIGLMGDDFDVLLMGASEQGLIHRAIFGALPDHLRHGRSQKLVGVVRGARPWVHRAAESVDRLLHLWVPQMERDTRIDVYESLQTGSQWGFDFMMLIALSTSIAALGLIQSSTAVVIGAMLVAPLMTPMLGAGLALLQSNRVLFKSAAFAIVGGFFLAMFIGALVGLFSPIKVLTSEMAARGAPNLLDLGVALISGFAAAYAYARPHLIAALPGVAIAAALVPPIATTGVCLATGEFRVAAGAAILFGTNVLSIIAGATLAFYAFGLRGRRKKRSWASRSIMGLFVSTFLLAIPLSGYLLNLADRYPKGPEGQLEQFITAHQYTLSRMERTHDVLEIRVQGTKRFEPKLLARLQEIANKREGAHLKLRVITELISQLD